MTPEPTGVTLVVGLGNPLLGDDGIGWRVAEEVRRRLASRAVGAGAGQREGGASARTPSVGRSSADNDSTGDAPTGDGAPDERIPVGDGMAGDGMARDGSPAGDAPTGDGAAPRGPAGDGIPAGGGPAGDDPAGGGQPRAREGRGHEGEVEVDHLAVGGLALMERLVGYRRAVLVDAMVTGEHPPGTVRRFAISEVPGREATHLDSAHDASLATALAAGRSLGADLPVDIAVIAIEAVRVTEFVESLTPEVEAAIPAAVEAVLAAIGETGG